MVSTKKPQFKATNVAKVQRKNFEDSTDGYTTHLYNIDGEYVGTKMPNGQVVFKSENVSKDTIAHRYDTGTPYQMGKVAHRNPKAVEYEQGKYYWIYR